MVLSPVIPEFPKEISGIQFNLQLPQATHYCMDSRSPITTFGDKLRGNDEI